MNQETKNYQNYGLIKNQFTEMEIFNLAILDILKQVENLDFYQQSDETKKQVFITNLKQEMLISVLKNLTNKVLELDLKFNEDKDLTKILLNSSSIEEFFEILTGYLATSQVLALSYYEYVALAYTQMCTKLYLPAKADFLEILKN